MATQIQMPKLGLTMTEGTIAEWLAVEGATVGAGAVVMTIETDKVEAEVEAPADGVVHHVRRVGETLEPGELVGWILADGEALPEGSPPPAERPTEADPTSASVAPPIDPTPPADGARRPSSPNARRVAAELGVDLASVVGTGPGGRVTSEDVEAAAPAGRGLGGRVLSSPNARRVAAELGVDVASVVGSGPSGRVVSEDVRAHAADKVGVGRPSPVAAPVVATPAGPAAGGRFVPFAAVKAAERLGIDIDDVVGTGPDGRVSRNDVYAHARASGAAKAPAAAPVAGPQPGEVVPLKGIRGVIAERMHSSLQSMAQLTLAMDVDMDRVVALREQLKDIGADELGAVPGYTDFVIAAAARALRQHPMMNAQLIDDRVELLEPVNVGMAVAVPDGLIVPVVSGADQLGLVDLALETSRLAAAARAKSLALAELEGGTFSVTALGMAGVDMFTPVINPPNAGILGVGRIRDDVAWAGDTPRKVQRLTLSLTWDHRVLDGVPAAAFAQTVKALLEQPLRLLD